MTLTVETLAALLREARYSAEARGQFDAPEDLAAWLLPRLLPQLGAGAPAKEAAS